VTDFVVKVGRAKIVDMGSAGIVDLYQLLTTCYHTLVTRRKNKVTGVDRLYIMLYYITFNA
jgi:hypothetical protein